MITKPFFAPRATQYACVGMLVDKFFSEMMVAKG
jgi:hypothetical protein